MHNTHFAARRARAGFTLIELVVVLAILAAVSALLVPQLDFLKRTADKTNGAANITQTMSNIQVFRTLKGVYPDKFDSLIDDGGTSMTVVLPKQSKYTESTLSADEAASLTKIGITTLMDHDTTVAYRGSPGASGQIERAVADGATIVAVTDADIVASIYPNGLLIGDRVDPDKDVDGIDGDGTTDNDASIKLVLLGVGPQCSAVGQTMTAPPMYTGVDQAKEYNRMLAVFAVFDDGDTNTPTKRAQLKAVLDSAGDFLTQELIEINENELQ